MNTLLTYLPTYLTLVSSAYLSHTHVTYFFSTFFCFPIAMALIIVTYSVTCLARQPGLGTSLYLTTHHCYTSLYLILVT